MGAYVLVDEVYLDCVWDNPQRSAFHLGPNFITTSSLTKVYGLSGIRCGWIFAPPPIADRLWKLIDLFDNIPRTLQLLGVIAFRNLPKIRERAHSLMESNRALYGPDAPRYGTTAFPRIEGMPVDRFCHTLRHEFETTVVPGEFFEMPDRVRVSLVQQPDIMVEGLRRLRQVSARRQP